MKRIICLFFMISLLTPLPVFADVLIEPDDSFYRWHADECYSLNKYYTAKEGVPVYQSPNSWLQLDQAEAGSTFLIEWVYTADNGDEWGLCESQKVSFWIAMNHLSPLYSHDEFIQEHASELMDQTITFNPTKSGYLILYEYPGSTWISDVLNTEWISEDSFTVHTVYFDDNGNQWGYMPYYMQHNGWINFDADISAEKINHNAPVIFLPKTSLFSFTLVPVLLLCLFTAAIAWHFYRKRGVHHESV